MHAAVLRYRVMAYITGVLIIVVVFVGIPLQLAAHNTIISNQVATVHGFLYIVYVIVAYMLEAGEGVRGWSRRSKERATSRARTSVPSWKRAPGRSSKL